MSVTSRLRASLCFFFAFFAILTAYQAARAQSKHFCDATPAGSGAYPVLPVVSTTATTTTYGAKLLTWTPIGNDTFCPIRQIVFNVPDTLCRGNCTSSPNTSPTIFVQLLQKDGKPVHRPLSYTFQSNLNGPAVEYTIDVQAPDDLLGDFLLDIQISGQNANGS